MEETKLFFTPLWRHSMRATASDWVSRRNAMLEKIYALMEAEEGVQKTNFGGWQSDEDLFKFDEFEWLLDNIIALGNTLAPEFCTDKQFNDGHLWANVNGKGNFNAMHTHPEAILSGTVYLKFDGEEQGGIEFFDAREGSPTAHWPCYTQFEEKNLFTSYVHSVVPEEGDILFFPGWLKHWVSPNLTDEDRVSISFNMSIR
ncbi:MAG: TIGR02466 family protein [Gammaproteobacteria bacterium]|nr:TIGR02466 family protein [Gammaproteobacteria bacterium]